MDDMQSRIAERRAQIERERAGHGSPDVAGGSAPKGLPSAAAEPAAGLPPSSPVPLPPVAPTEEPIMNSATWVQDSIAARRAEVERERAAAEAQAKADRETREAARRAAAEAEWAARARHKKAIMDAATPGATPAQLAAKERKMDQFLREAIRRRWTGGEIGLVALLGGGGALLFSSHPVWGTILMLLAIAAYLGCNANHKEEAVKEYPDLFGDDVPPPTSDG